MSPRWLDPVKKYARSQVRITPRRHQALAAVVHPMFFRTTRSLARNSLVQCQIELQDVHVRLAEEAEVPPLSVLRNQPLHLIH